MDILDKEEENAFLDVIIKFLMEKRKSVIFLSRKVKMTD